MILLKGSSNVGIGCNPALDKYDKTCSNLKHLPLNQANKNDSGSYDKSCLHLNDIGVS